MEYAVCSFSSTRYRESRLEPNVVSKVFPKGSDGLRGLLLNDPSISRYCCVQHNDIKKTKVYWR